MRVYEGVGEALRDAGVEVVFGLMGDGNLRFIPHLDACGVRYYGTRHESAAVAMADGFARASGRTGICTVTQGPGLTNTLTALTAARKARTPLVVIAGDTPASAPGHIQSTDQAAVFRAAGAGVQVLRSAATIVEDIDRAIRRAVREQRPVGISIPTDLQEEECAPPPEASLVGPRLPRLRPDPAAVAAAVDLITFSHRPVIVAGLGAVRSSARSELETLAEQIGALVATTVPAKGLFAGNPFDLGIAGDFATELGSELIGGADLILAFGASLNYWTTCNRELISPSALVVQCDVDATAIGAHLPVTYGIVGDVGATAQALLDELVDRQEADLGYRTDAMHERIGSHRLEETFADRGTADTVDPRSLVLALDRLLPADRILAVDGGHFSGLPSTYMSVPDPSAFLFAVNFGAVGLGLGTAMGAAVGRPDRLAVAMIGDGGLMMSLGDLDTAVRYQLPLLVVVVNDGAYGAELHHLQLLGMPSDQAVFDDPDFAGIAVAVGARGVTVRKAADLEQLRGWLDAPDGPLIVDAKVNREVRASWLEEVLRPQVIARSQRL